MKYLNCGEEGEEVEEGVRGEEEGQ